MFKKTFSFALLSLSLIQSLAHAGTPWEECVENEAMREKITNAPIKSKKVTMGVADSGFEAEHKVFHNNLGLGFNARDKNHNVNISLVDFSNNNHGTIVAGILAQMNDTLPITPIKLGKQATQDTIKQGIVKAKELGITAFNLSVYIPRNWEFYLPALMDLANSGTVISIGIGNNAEYLNNPNITIGNTTQSLADWLKEAKGRIVLVGATERKNDTLQQAFYSNKCPDSLLSYFISVPGTKIMTAVLNDKFDEKHGTSMAAPIFLGAVVRLATVFDVSLDKAREVLFSTAANGTTRSDGVKISYHPSVGRGMLDFSAAWNLLEKESSPLPKTLKSNIKYAMPMPPIKKNKMVTGNLLVEYKRRNGIHGLDDVDLGFMKPKTDEPTSIFRAQRKLPTSKNNAKEELPTTYNDKTVDKNQENENKKRYGINEQDDENSSLMEPKTAKPVPVSKAHKKLLPFRTMPKEK